MVTRDEIYLAALLHDIGKFWQRADEKGLSSSKIIKEDFKKFENTLCPKNEKGLSHKHVMWTAYFIEKYSSVFKKIFEKNYGDFMFLSARHHNATTLEESIIQKADHYSAGIDRTMENGWKDAAEEDDNKWDAFKRVYMRPIFSVIGEYSDMRYKAPISKLVLTENFILYEDNNSDYSNLWSEFENEFNCINNIIEKSNFKSFSETLLALLHKFTIRIPASTISLPDVSLFDHLKTTAAFAICLYDYLEENTDLKRLNYPDEKPFLFVGGDLSGIQKFIYSIAARGAAKNLKGRSFYLQLLIDNIVQYLLDNLNLYSANVIYQTGGVFYLIVPNLDEVKNKLIDIGNYLEKKLFEYHKTELYLAIDYIEFGENEIFNGKIGDIWDSLNVKLSRKKLQKFKSLIKDNYKKFFEPIDIFLPNCKRDYITGELLGEKTFKLDDDNEESIVNEYTFQQIELGKKLKNADYWIVSKNKILYWEEDFFNPLGIGYYNYFVSSKFLEKKAKELKASIDNVVIKRINNTDFLKICQKGVENIYSFVFYGGNDYPKDENENPKTFEELAGVDFINQQKEKGKNGPDMLRLGILRMDVDNLGFVFKNAFKHKENIIPSFSRYSNLSRNIDLFFTGYINKIWENNEAFKKYSQIIYAGGDDVFIVGKWDILIDFAREIQKKFKIWTCNNPMFSISAGIAIVPPKFPILRGAELANEEENNAKNHIYNGKEKNAISLFGHAFEWEAEFKMLCEYKEKIKQLLENKDISQSFPSTIFNLMKKAFSDEYQQNLNIENYFKHKVKWLVAYNFKRAIKIYKEEASRDFFDKWANNIFTGKIEEIGPSKYDALQMLAFASCWADYELRSKLKN